MVSELYHLVFIDDDKDFLHSMNMAISSKLFLNGDELDIESHFVDDPNKGLAFMQELAEEQEKIAVIISDQQMPELTGIEFLEKANKFAPKAMKMLLTGYASLDSARYAINHQILDQYVTKPIEDYDNFVSLIKNAIRTFHLNEEKERAEKEIEKYVRELELTNAKIKSLHQAAEKIAYLAQGFTKLDLEEVLDLIITKIPGIFNAKYSSLFLFNEEENCLELTRSNYLKEEFNKEMNEYDLSPMMVALRLNEIIVLPEIENSSYDFLNKECLGNSCIIIPFSLSGERSSTDILGKTENIKGVLNMGNITSMEAEDVVIYAASLIRNILGINIMNAHLYQKTQRLALIDSLTGLYNKHIFMEFIRKECNYSERHGAPLFLAIFDIDDFKTINDTHGHRIGDEVLTEIGVICKKVARKSDMISRFGGDEFAWTIHCGEMEDIIALLERFREEVSGTEFPKDIQLSISIGLTQYSHRSGDGVEKLIDRADRALYRAKEKGKNRVEFLFENENGRRS